MNANHLLGTSLFLGLILTGCVDSNYDIANADFTTRININDLVIPLNLDAVKVDKLVDLTDNDIVDVFNDPATGKDFYAVCASGNLESSPISIPPFTIMSVLTSRNTSARALLNNEYILGDNTADIRLTPNFLPESITRLTGIYMEGSQRHTVTVTIQATLTQPYAGSALHMSGKDITLMLPKGLYLNGRPAVPSCGSYDPQTGILNVDLTGETALTANAAEIRITVPYDAIPEVGNQTNSEYNLFALTQFGLSRGTFVFNDGSADVNVGEVTFDCSYSIPEMEVAAIDGTVNGDIEKIDIDAVDLNDLPDMLSAEDTYVIPQDPTLFFDVHNPYGENRLELETRLHMESMFRNGSYKDVASPMLSFTGSQAHTSLSPEKPFVVLPAYAANLHEVYMETMRDMLTYGTPEQACGLPNMIELQLLDPTFLGHVSRMPLDDDTHNNAHRLSGTYEFFCPLSFEVGTFLSYTTDVDIAGDSMENIYVRYLNVSGNAYSEAATDIELSVSAVDSSGRTVGVSETMIIPAHTEAPVSLRIAPAGDLEIMNDLSHLTFHSVIRQTADIPDDPLAPETAIEIKDLKITLDGYYETKDDDED